MKKLLILLTLFCTPLYAQSEAGSTDEDGGYLVELMEGVQQAHTNRCFAYKVDTTFLAYTVSQQDPALRVELSEFSEPTKDKLLIESAKAILRLEALVKDQQKWAEQQLALVHSNSVRLESRINNIPSVTVVKEVGTPANSPAPYVSPCPTQIETEAQRQQRLRWDAKVDSRMGDR